MQTAHSERKILAVIFLTILIDMLGIGILIPVFPLLVANNAAFNILPPAWTTAEGYILLGWLMAAFPLAQFLCAPILGQLADRYGRRKILAISISGSGIAYLLFAIGILTKNLPLMFLSRIMDGISGGNISVAQAVIGDISSPANRAKNFGLIGMAFGLGFIMGPLLGGKLSDSHLVSWFNVATPFWFAAFLSCINVFSVLRQLPETLKIPSTKRLDISRPIQNIIKAFSVSGLREIIPSTFLFNAGFTFYTTFWGVVLATQFNFRPGQIGDFYAYIGIMVVLAQGLVVRRISGKIRDYKVLYFSMFGTGLCLVAYYFIPGDHPGWIYVLPPLMATSNALTMAFGSALITRVSPAAIRGEAMGIYSSSSALAQAIPALLAGYIAAHHARLPILVGGITVIFAGILFCRLFKSKEDDSIPRKGSRNDVN